MRVVFGACGGRWAGECKNATAQIQCVLEIVAVGSLGWIEIFADVAAEKHRVLWDNGQTLMKALEREMRDVDAVVGNAAGHDVRDPKKRQKQCAFAAASAADNCDTLSGFKSE